MQWQDNKEASAEATLRSLLDQGVYVFSDRAKTQIEDFSAGDRVCFYKSKTGVVAEAVVAGPFQEKSVNFARSQYRLPWVLSMKDVRYFFDKPIVLDAFLRSRLDAYRGYDHTNSWGNGTTGTSQHLGDIEFYNFSNGQSATRQNFGGIDFYSSPSPGLSGTVQSFGNQSFGMWNDGTRSTHQNLGGMQFVTYQRGNQTKRCTSQSIGSHQLAAMHKVAMEMIGSVVPHSRDAAIQNRRLNAAVRCMTAYQQGLLTLRKLRLGGHQRIFIQHIQVREGSQAIVGDVVSN